jgi:hypothetical protein
MPQIFGEALIDLKIAAIRRHACKTDRRGIIDELQRRLRKQQHFGLHGLAAIAQCMPRLFPLASIPISPGSAGHRVESDWKFPRLSVGARRAPPLIQINKRSFVFKGTLLDQLGLGQQARRNDWTESIGGRGATSGPATAPPTREIGWRHLMVGRACADSKIGSPQHLVTSWP